MTADVFKAITALASTRRRHSRRARESGDVNALITALERFGDRRAREPEGYESRQYWM